MPSARFEGNIRRRRMIDAIAAVAFSGKGEAELFPPTLQVLPSMPLRVEGDPGRVRGARGSQVTLAMSL